MSVLLEKRLFTVDEYYKMAEAGILREDDRVELIGGEIIQISPIGNRHAAIVDQLIYLLRSLMEKGIRIRIQNPLYIDEMNVPQPDCMLLKSESTNYFERAPTPNDVLLLIEVADSSLIIDKNIKMPLYAIAGIPEAWLVDITTNTIFVYREPTAKGYQSMQKFSRGKSIVPLADLNLKIEVDEIFG